MVPVERIVKADQVGRLNLGRKLAGPTCWVVEHGSRLVLEHVETVHVPAEEACLYRNAQALASVQRGLQQITPESSPPAPTWAPRTSWQRQFSLLHTARMRKPMPNELRHSMDTRS